MLTNVQWSFLLAFLQQRSNYVAFGFVDEFPTMGALVIFALAIAPFATVLFRNSTGRSVEFNAGESFHSVQLV